MKIVFLVPKLNVSSGVAKVISTKANYILKNPENEVILVSQNNGNSTLFFGLDKRVKLVDFTLKGNFYIFFKSYKRQVNSLILKEKPDILVLADNGLKAFLFPIIIPVAIPLVLEIHCSKYVSEKENTSFKDLLWRFIELNIRNFGIKKFKNVVLLSKNSQKEWNLPTSKVIPNPVDQRSISNDLHSKKIICVTRNAFEKGIDRLFPIWSQLEANNPDWTLEIFCDTKGYYDLQFLLDKYKLKNCIIKAPCKTLETEYESSSIFVCTSRFEAFPLVVLEALSFGIPIVAFDCPIGMNTILSNDFGFLIENGNQEAFVSKLEILMQDFDLRTQMGKLAKLESEKYLPEKILKKYENYLLEVVSKDKR
jgi:glycosyltransferase involved in cell wall biosynthesis